ncbi:hypothetical protein BDA99DRAFT_560971 [Phascolomyces articulosus]|uniref:Uncharacterized protein n=1 Tax=Phascolomyces articulosus TaxID=60185 RepID=A0AAD5JXU0_9FUNG|nr:hypothetical protein BDA99DRAFT_560971 [Phascolomyces articulosus]
MADDAPFSFEFDDDVFVTKAERIIPEQPPYVAKEETDGWFHKFDDYESLMLERHGPNQLKSAIEHDYFHKRYEKALKGALVFIEIADTGRSKVTANREMIEIAIHCAVRANQLDVAEKLLDRPQTTIEPGNMLVQARVYSLCGRPDDALSALIRYHKLRRSDYHAWHLLATIMVNNSNNNNNSSGGVVVVEENNMQLHIAHAAIQRAIKTMTASQWTLSIDHVRRRYERELEELQTLGRSITEHQGNSELFFTWMEQQQQEGSCILLSQEQLTSKGLHAFHREDIEYIYESCIKYQVDQIDLEENEMRNVKDL